MDACTGEDDHRLPGWLPNGLYVRYGPDPVEPELPEDEPDAPRTRQWWVTGRNPDFSWDLVITYEFPHGGLYEFRCTRCGISDQAASMADVLRLLHAGAHLHDTDPAGGCRSAPPCP